MTAEMLPIYWEPDGWITLPLGTAQRLCEELELRRLCLRHVISALRAGERAQEPQQAA